MKRIYKVCYGIKEKRTAKKLSERIDKMMESGAWYRSAGEEPELDTARRLWKCSFPSLSDSEERTWNAIRHTIASSSNGNDGRNIAAMEDRAVRRHRNRRYLVPLASAAALLIACIVFLSDTGLKSENPETGDDEINPGAMVRAEQIPPPDILPYELSLQKEIILDNSPELYHYSSDESECYVLQYPAAVLSQTIGGD